MAHGWIVPQVWFQVIPPWHKPTRMEQAPIPRQVAVALSWLLVLLAQTREHQLWQPADIPCVYQFAAPACAGYYSVFSGLAGDCGLTVDASEELVAI